MKRRRVSGLNFGKKRRKINVPLVKEIVTWAIELAVVIAAAFVVVYFIGLRTSVVGQSMSTTLEAGDEVLVNRFVYKLSEPKRDDIIVFLPNGNEKSHYYIKRVVAVPGDTVQIKDGVLYVNGSQEETSYEVERMEEAGLAAEEITIGAEEYFVLGDNRNNSEDSRYANIGNVKRAHVIGKAWFIVSPFHKFGFL